MSETTIPAPPGFSRLTKAEQLRYVQDLWDQIAEHPGVLPVPESHLKLVEHRLKHNQNDESPPAHSAFEVLDRLNSESS
jgi:putative addiction module component (TIGR02574 family)